MENWSTSMSSLAISTTLPLLRRMLAALEEQKYLLEAQIWRERSNRVATGLPPGTRPSKRLHMYSPIETTSYVSGETTFCQNFQPDKLAHITNLLPLTRQSGCESEGDKRSYSLTAMNSRTSTQLFSFLTVSRQDLLDSEVTVTRGRDLPLPTSVEDSTVRTDVTAQWGPAVSTMPVSNASSQAMGKKTALSKHEASYGMHPKYLHYNVWDAWDGGEDDTCVESLQCLADWTE